MIITIAVGIAFLLLAALNAAFSQPPNDFVLPDDRTFFIPPVLKGEGIYRSFMINVAFLGIATVMSGFQFGTSTHFYISGSAMLLIILNLAWGFFGGLCLRADSKPITWGKRVAWVIVLIVVSLLFFVFSVSAVYHTATSKESRSQSIKQASESNATNGQDESR